MRRSSEISPHTCITDGKIAQLIASVSDGKSKMMGCFSRAALTAAARDRVAMRRYGHRSVDQYLAQGTLLNQRAAVVGVPLGEPPLRVLLELEGAPLRFARFAREYANLARRTPHGQGLLLMSEELSPRDALLQAREWQGIDFP